MSTAENIYQSSVIGLSKSEQLRPAAMILDELASSSGSTLDYGDSWSLEDMHDVSAHAANCAAEADGEEHDGA